MRLVAARREKQVIPYSSHIRIGPACAEAAQDAPLRAIDRGRSLFFLKMLTSLPSGFLASLYSTALGSF